MRELEQIKRDKQSLQQQVEQQVWQLQELTTEKQQSKQEIEELREQIRELTEQSKQYRSKIQTSVWVINRSEITLSEKELGRGAYGWAKEAILSEVAKWQ